MDFTLVTFIILCLYSNIRKLCQFSMDSYDKNKVKENPLPAKARHSHVKKFCNQLNILNNLIFMHKVKTETAPAIFLPKFQKPAHPYPTRFSKLNYIKPTFQLSRSKYRISVRGSALWKLIDGILPILKFFL